MSYAAQHPNDPGLKMPLVLSAAFHLALFAFLAVSTIFSARGEMWGGPGGDNSVTVGLVGRLAGVPLPRPSAVTASRVVDTTKGLYKSEPTPKEVVSDAKPIPEFTKEKKPPIVNRHPSKVLEDNTPPPPNAVPYGRGGSPAIPYGASSAPVTQAATQQGGVGFSTTQGPGGAEFAGRFPAYVEAVRNRVSSNWLQATIDPSLRWAPRVAYTFQILRNGTIANIQRLQSSGNASVDNSALRAILASSPLAPLPSGYSGNNVSVEFWFDFHR